MENPASSPKQEVWSLPPLLITSTSTQAEGSDPAQRLKTACSHCRNQKIRCKNDDDLRTPCERCKKMVLSCVYEPRHSRGRLRSGSESVFEDGGAAPKRRMLVAKEGLGNGYGNERGSRVFVAVNSHVREPETTMGTRAPSTPEVGRTTYTSPLGTLERAIDGLRLAPEVIDNLFSQFFRYYHPFLPVLDPCLCPNDYHAQSSFLFWSILAVASGRWPKDPTLMPALRSRVLGHAMTTIFSATVGTSTITAMLLLLSWSFPETQNYDEVPYVFASALLHAAMRIGMNTPDCSQDFSRVKVSVSEAEAKKRFQIWAYCLVLYQRYVIRNAFLLAANMCVGPHAVRAITLGSSLRIYQQNRRGTWEPYQPRSTSKWVSKTSSRAPRSPSQTTVSNLATKCKK